jgi:predicted metal-dependent hydrolase
MAQYTFGENRVSISRSLDSPDTPELVLKYLMFHELLHGVVGKGAFRNQNMKLQHRPHSRRFKELEKLFPERDEAEALLKAIAKKSEKQIKQKRSIKPNGLD